MGINDRKLRVVFFGTPASVLPFVEQLYKSEQLVGIITQPPKIAGRGFRVKMSPVKELAGQLNIRSFHPEKLSDKKFIDELSGLAPDIGVVAAFGRKIPRECIGASVNGLVNIHYSLLPKYRGPAPIQHALLNQERYSGVTVFSLTENIDEGPVIMQEKLEIRPEDDYISLEEKLTKLGQDILSKTLKMIKENRLKTTAQVGEPSKAPMVKKEDALINWHLPANNISAQVRAYVRWPKSFFITENGAVVKILKSRVIVFEDGKGCEPGVITGLIKNEGFIVKCGKLDLVVQKVHQQGKKEMSGWAFWQGSKLKVGDRLKTKE